MFRKLTGQIQTLDEKRQILEADWEEKGNHSLLDFYIKMMPKLTDSERCSIFVHDPIQETVWLKAGTGVDEKQIELSLDDDSIVGKVIATGTPTIIHGLNEKDGAHKLTDGETGFVTRSIMCIPIRSLDGKEITGAVQLLNKRADETFSDEDQDVVVEMAHFLEWSLENIHYHAAASDLLGDIYGVLTKSIIALVGILILVSPVLMVWGFPYIARIFAG